MHDEKTTAKAEGLDFGHEHYVRALENRVRRHFADKGEEDALVVGLYNNVLSHLEIRKE